MGQRRAATQLLFDPLDVELLECLAALTPRPRINLTLYQGVLAPRAAWRALIVGFGETAGGEVSVTDATTLGETGAFGPG